MISANQNSVMSRNGLVSNRHAFFSRSPVALGNRGPVGFGVMLLLPAIGMLALTANGQTVTTQTSTGGGTVVRMRVLEVPGTPAAGEPAATSEPVAGEDVLRLTLVQSPVAPAVGQPVVANAASVPPPASSGPPPTASAPPPSELSPLPVAPAPPPAVSAPGVVMPSAEPVVVQPVAPDGLLGGNGIAPCPCHIICPPIQRDRCGVFCDCPNRRGDGPGWAAQRMIPWQVFAQGEYVGPPRSAARFGVPSPRR